MLISNASCLTIEEGLINAVSHAHKNGLQARFAILSIYQYTRFWLGTGGRYSDEEDVGRCALPTPFGLLLVLADSDTEWGNTILCDKDGHGIMEVRLLQ